MPGPPGTRTRRNRAPAPTPGRRRRRRGVTGTAACGVPALEPKIALRDALSDFTANRWAPWSCPRELADEVLASAASRTPSAASPSRRAVRRPRAPSRCREQRQQAAHADATAPPSALVSDRRRPSSRGRSPARGRRRRRRALEQQRPRPSAAAVRVGGRLPLTTPVTLTSTIRRCAGAHVGVRSERTRTPARRRCSPARPSPPSRADDVSRRDGCAPLLDVAHVQDAPCTADVAGSPAARPPPRRVDVVHADPPAAGRKSSAVARPMPRAAPLTKMLAHETSPGRSTRPRTQWPTASPASERRRCSRAPSPSSGVRRGRHSPSIARRSSSASARTWSMTGTRSSSTQLAAAEPRDRDRLVVLGRQPGGHLEGRAEQGAVDACW